MSGAPDPFELTCYVHEGWSPRIRPAGLKRDWMDATDLRFAYRCLPLAIANTHGWEIGAPCGFRARWTGGPGTDAVEIRPDAGAPPGKLPVSLFGNGTITFHVEGIIRTPPGWNLWVGGPPNEAKDGIAPLGGVIETDWSPYTFTMNWRFTRKDKWVRFEEDEAFCFFFPVQRGVLDAVQPRIRPLDEAPELKAAFKGWEASRADFQEWVRKTQPQNAADQWQKLYFRGLNPSGAPGAPDHQSRLRLASFEEAAPSCPVAHAPAKAQPAGILANAVQPKRFDPETAARDAAINRLLGDAQPKKRG